MNVINIVVGGFTLIVVLLVFMQPILIMNDTLTGIVSGSTTKYGTDSDGNVVAVGESLFGGELILGLVALIGVAFVVGFLIWAGKGGESDVSQGIQQGGF